VLETISATGVIIPPFVVWANKVHCIGFYGSIGTYSRPATFRRSPNGYMDDDLGLDYISKHFDQYTPRINTPDTPHMENAYCGWT